MKKFLTSLFGIRNKSESKSSKQPFTVGQVYVLKEHYETGMEGCDEFYYTRIQPGQKAMFLRMSSFKAHGVFIGLDEDLRSNDKQVQSIELNKFVEYRNEAGGILRIKDEHLSKIEEYANSLDLLCSMCVL